MKTSYFEELKRRANCRSTKIYEQLDIAEFRAAVCGPNQANPLSNPAPLGSQGCFKTVRSFVIAWAMWGPQPILLRAVWDDQNLKNSKFSHIFFRNIALFGLGNILSVIGKEY